MAITRRMQPLKVVNSRQLRSGKVLPGPQVTQLAHSSSGRIQKHLSESRARRQLHGRKQTLSSKQSHSHQDIGTSAEPERRNVLLPESASSEITVSKETGFPTQPTEAEGDRVSPTVTATTSVTNGLPINLEDVGLPADELWDHDKAYDQRICPDHREREYLLRPSARWMRPSDFHIDAQLELDASFQESEADFDTLFQEGQAKIIALCAKSQAQLDALFQGFQSHPPQFQPDSQLYQAECTTDLSSQIHTVVQIGWSRGEKVYLTEWKACWVRKSCIDDPAWVLESLMAGNEELAGTQAFGEGV